MSLLGFLGVAGVVGAAAWALLRLRTVVDVGCGYKAKVLCTGIFASGRQMDAQRAEEVFADSYWILRPFTAAVDARSASVTASLAGVRPRTAIHRTGLGATLLPRQASGHPAAPAMACPASAPAVRAASSIRPDVQRVVDRAFEEPNPARLRRTHAVVVVHDGDIVAERYARGVQVDTPLPGWSMAKSVLSALVGMLVDDGRLSLGSRELLHRWRSPDPRAAISLEDLLRMRSGLRFSEVYSNPWSDVLQMLFTVGDTAAYAASRPLAAAPGSVWSYASGTTNILSAIVRQTVGQAEYAAWPRRALFDRLGMSSAIVEPDAAGTFVFSSFMLATARDWARYGELWVNGGCWAGGTLLSPEWIRFSTSPTAQSPGGEYGAHWWLKLKPEIGGDQPAAAAIAQDAFFAVGHEGQTLTVIPSRRLVIVRLGASIRINACIQAVFDAWLQ